MDFDKKIEIRKEINIMTVEQQKAIMIDRINKMKNNKKDKGRIVQKLERKMRKM